MADRAILKPVGVDMPFDLGISISKNCKICQVFLFMCGRGRLTQDFAQWYNGIILLKTIASSSQAQQDCRPSWAFLLSMTGFHTLPVLTACFPDEFAVIVAVIGKVYQSCW